MIYLPIFPAYIYIIYFPNILWLRHKKKDPVPWHAPRTSMNLGAASPSIGSRLHGPDPLGVSWNRCVLVTGFPPKIHGFLWRVKPFTPYYGTRTTVENSNMSRKTIEWLEWLDRCFVELPPVDGWSQWFVKWLATWGSMQQFSEATAIPLR